MVVTVGLDNRKRQVNTLEERPVDVEDEPVFAGIEGPFGKLGDSSVLVRLLQRDQRLAAVQADFHPGLDISAEKGTSILATADGIVELAAPSGDYGNLVVITHGFGLATRYGHLSKFAVWQGQQVKRGDVIGYVGATGRATGPHLHYEVLANGKLMNPLQLLAGKSAQD